MKYILLLPLFFFALSVYCQTAVSKIPDQATYLSDLKTELQKEWPKNRTINIVFHGHSVPSGYFKTPIVNTLSAYPNLVLKKLKKIYPYAVVNVIVTAIGGENSVQGAERFERDVIIHKPDLILIDYGLNDRGPGLEKAYIAWNKMIKQAKDRGIKVILLTPSPDQSVSYADTENVLKKHTDQIRKIASENQVGLADSYQAFGYLYKDKEQLSKYMSQVNHPNELGHELIANEIMSWFQKFPAKETFKNPSLVYFPRPLWFWNDTKVTAEVIDSQMQTFRDSCNYGGFGILPFGKKFKPEYLSEEYFDVYGKALEKAAKLGLTMCLYDEYGFPSGGAGPHNGDGVGRFEKQFPDQTIKRLDKTELDISGPSVCNQKVPKGKLMAVVAMEKKSMKRLSLTDRIVDGELTWKVPAGDWKLMFFVCVKDGDPIVDYLDPEPVRNFIQMTHEAYYSRFKKYFGTVITGTFFDEPTMYRANGRMWTGLFNEKFKKKYGFDPELYYPALWYDIGPETRAARNYLFGFRTELYAEGFTKTINDWSIAHHISATGHQDQEEVLNPVSVSGDLMKCFKYLEIPGIDKIGGNRPAERYYKLISSAAYNWNRQLVMSETYGAMGNISWNEIFSVAMDQYTKGINLLIPHAVWYDDKNVTFKPELSQRNPLYADSLKIFNQFLARLNLILQQEGRHVADIAVLYPIQSLQGDHYLDGPLGNYKGGVDIPKTDYIDVANWLTEDAGKDFTFLHPEVLDEKCNISDGKLHLRNPVNYEEFSVLVIPSCKTISISNLKKIKDFYEKGGNLIFTTRLPKFSAEPGKDKEVTEIINSIFSVSEQTGSILKRSSGGGKALFIPDPDGHKMRTALEKVQLNFDVDYPVNKNLRYIHKVINGNDVFYFANLGGSDIKTTLHLRDSQTPEAWDPHTGETAKIGTATENENDHSQTGLPLGLAPYHSVFLISAHK